MPSIPTYTKCASLGCKNNRSRFNSFCLEHGGVDVARTYTNKKRQDASKLYSSPNWKHLRQIQLSKHPLCAGCIANGIVTAAVHVDHVFPWNQIGKAAFYYNVFQSLCASCHSSKTSLEQKGIYRRYGPPIKDFTINDYASAAYAFEDNDPTH